MVYVGEEIVPFNEFIKMAYMQRTQLSATGFYKTPNIYWDRAAGKGNPFYYYAYGAACSEVLIDTLTGEYRIEKTDILGSNFDVQFSNNICFPEIRLGFHHFIHQAKDKMEAVVTAFITHLKAAL